MTTEGSSVNLVSRNLVELAHRRKMEIICCFFTESTRSLTVKGLHDKKQAEVEKRNTVVETKSVCGGGEGRWMQPFGW